MKDNIREVMTIEVTHVEEDSENILETEENHKSKECSNSRGRSEARRTDNQRDGRSSSRKRSIKCAYCKLNGHVSKNCFKLEDDMAAKVQDFL